MSPPLPPRPRPLYLLLIAATIAAGLIEHRFRGVLPHVVADNAPDALYALMAFWIAGFLFPRTRAATLAAGALVFCCAVEAAQLYHAPWFERIRHTTLGGLVLGYGFAWNEIVPYTLGVAAGWAIEPIWRRPPA